MDVEWKPHEPDERPAAPPPDFITIDGEAPPLRDLLDNAIAIKDRLDAAQEQRSGR